MGPYALMLSAWAVVLTWVTIVIITNKKTHPKALFYLFFVELWERFSYYGMRALLVLYMTSELVKGGLGYEDKKAYGVYAAYGALVYLTPILGGFFADKYMGFRKAIAWGSLLMALGHFMMAIEHEFFFYIALALLILGNGFFKPNMSCLIGQLYKEDDPRRDGGFTIFYMGINIGAFLTPLTCGTIGELHGWHYGFGLAGIGMLVGYLIFLYCQKSGILGDKGYPPEAGLTGKVAGIPKIPAIYLGSFLMLPVIYFLLVQNDLVDLLLGIIGPAAILFILYLASKYQKQDMQRMWVIVVLLLFTTLFWSFFELAGSALTLFTARHVGKTIFGVNVVTSMFQSINPFFIMVFAPIFSWLWIKLGRAGIEPAAPVKFAIGIILLGAGFLVLNLGKGMIDAYTMPAIFMVLLYLLHTLGELTLSPVGLSMVTKLSPKQILGFVMGFWFLSSSVAHQAGKFIANLTAVDSNATAAESLDQALGVFNNLGLVAVGAGVFLLLLSPMLTKWMHGIK